MSTGNLAVKRQLPFGSVSVMVWSGATPTGEKTALKLIEEGVKINRHVQMAC